MEDWEIEDGDKRSAYAQGYPPAWMLYGQEAGATGELRYVEN